MTASSAVKHDTGCSAVLPLPQALGSRSRQSMHGSSSIETDCLALVQDTFVGPTFAANGNKWLDSPQATLMGMYNGNMSSVILQLNA